jgi:hypothetical protein
MTTDAVVSEKKAEVGFDGSGLPARPNLTPRAARALLAILLGAERVEGTHADALGADA